jgi:hypothetical protein
MKNYKEKKLTAEDRKEIAKVDMKFKFRQSMFRAHRHLI